MNIKSNRQEVSMLIGEIELRVGQFQACCVEEERREECAEVKRRLEELCEEGRMRIGEADAGLLVALMDAYEVTRDEGMLQEGDGGGVGKSQGDLWGIGGGIR